ncbi:glutathione S-transferase [Phenylobacterium sp.]|uniref:glutathione S-transferase n=1 Tax=Phenylobacterium sp. TaxID=1871053 RepID=UPI002735020D|nr:glutathione S-transferase [Phenylobacterium sp.]MDP3855519.1 glutathione S-transferase [Phenylobacterium sp.]
MLVVHHLNNSRSQRVLWLLEELGVPYEIQHHQRDAKTMLAPPELRAIHPLGKSPVIVDGDVVFPETGAIVDWIVERYGNGRLVPPAGTAERSRWTYWLHYAEGSAMPPLLMKLVFSRLPANAPFFLRPVVKTIAARAQAGFVDPSLKLHFDYWESELGKSEWFAGNEFSAADVMMSFPVEAAANRGDALNGRPRLKAFLEKIHARPAYRRALEKGGPYAYAD